MEDEVDPRSGHRPKLKTKTDDLKPFINYRNASDDKIASAIQEAARQLRAEGKPLVKN